MAWEPNAVALAVLVSGVVATAVGLAVLRERPDPMAWLVVAFMATVAAWSFCHGIAYGLQDPDAVAWWGRLAVVPATLAPVPFLFVVLRVAGAERWLSRPSVGLVAAPSLLLGLAAVTDPLHRLFWRSYEVHTVYGASIVSADPGPLRWLAFAYPYLLTLVALAILGRVVRTAGPVYRKQATLLFLAGVVPLGTSAAFSLGLMPGPEIDLTAVALTASGVTFALALFHFDLVDLRPVAHRQLVASLDDAIVVVGPDGEVRDANPTARRVFDDLRVDRAAAEVLPEPALTEGEELTAWVDGARRIFRTRTTPLYERGERLGEVLHLQDVTEVVEREQRVSVLNRVLRHNVRNEMTVAIGHLDLLSGSDPDPEHVATARDSLERVVAFAEKARSIEQTLQHSDHSAVVAVEPVVESVLSAARERFPAATIQRAGDDASGAGGEASCASDAAGDTSDDGSGARHDASGTSDAASGAGDDGTATESSAAPEDGAATDDGATDEIAATDDGAWSEGPVVEVCDELLFERSLWELVENGVVHNDRDAPTVTVRVAATSETVYLRVSDDGDGVPLAEQEILKDQPESALRHGSGLGLWLVQWTASLSGGAVHFEDDGSTVVLALPTGDPEVLEGEEAAAPVQSVASDD